GLLVGEPRPQEISRVGEHHLAPPRHRTEVQQLRAVQGLRRNALRLVPVERFFANLVQPHFHTDNLPTGATAKAKGFPPPLSIAAGEAEEEGGRRAGRRKGDPIARGERTEQRLPVPPGLHLAAL